MNLKPICAGVAFAFTIGLAGCANDGSLAIATGSINGQQAKPVAKRIDPACVALMARIDDLRREGTPERLAKVSTGKSKTASVKRSALARMTELDKANSQFQQKCSTLAAPKTPPASPAKTAAATQAATAATTAAKKAASTAVAKTAVTKATSAAKAAVQAKATAAVKSAAVNQVKKTATAAQ